MTTPLSRRLVIGGLAALGPMAALAQAPTGPQVGKAPTAFKPPYPGQGKVQRLDPGLDALIAPDAQIEEVCDGFVHADPIRAGQFDRAVDGRAERGVRHGVGHIIGQDRLHGGRRQVN